MSRIKVRRFRDTKGRGRSSSRGFTGPFYAFVVTNRDEAIEEFGADDNNVGYDTAAIFVSLAQPADLHVGTITVPNSATVGTPFTLSYVLENLGANIAAGRWHDRLFLSTDAVFSLDDIPLGLREHTIVDPNIPPGENATLEFRGTLPAVVPGDYHVVLRTDVFNQLPESNETNNVTASLASFSLDLPQITLVAGRADVDFERHIFNGATVSLFYRLRAQAGQTLAFDATWLPIPNFEIPRQTVTSLYIAAGRVPSPGDFDFAQTELLRSFSFTHSEQRLILPQTVDGDYFIRIDIRDTHALDFRALVDGLFFSGSEEHFTFSVTALPFTVSAVVPGRPATPAR